MKIKHRNLYLYINTLTTPIERDLTLDPYALNQTVSYPQSQIIMPKNADSMYNSQAELLIIGNQLHKNSFGGLKK